MDESVPGSANLCPLRRRQSRHLHSLEPPSSLRLCGRACVPGPSFALSPTRAHAPRRSSTHCEKKRAQFARTCEFGALTAARGAPRVSDAPSTERSRLMALRSAAASAAVSREAGRRRHRLGAFRCGPRRLRAPPTAPGVRRQTSSPTSRPGRPCKSPPSSGDAPELQRAVARTRGPSPQIATNFVGVVLDRLPSGP